jgi:hypothetical protein
MNPLWWWRKVRPAAIPQNLRDQFEQFGEDVLAGALAAGQESEPQPELASLLRQHRQSLWLWLTERRDIADRQRQRTETVEIAILVFVIVGVVSDVCFFVRSAIGSREGLTIMKSSLAFATLLISAASSAALGQQDCRQHYDGQTGKVHYGCEPARSAVIADPTCDPPECANERFAGTTCYMGEECGAQYIVRIHKLASGILEVSVKLRAYNFLNPKVTLGLPTYATYWVLCKPRGGYVEDERHIRIEEPNPRPSHATEPAEKLWITACKG